LATSSLFRRRLFAAAALLASGAGSGCTQIDNALAAVPVFAFLRESPSFDPYEHPLQAPPGSVPFESPNGPVLPPLQATEQALNEFAAGPHGRNPLAVDDQAALTLGQLMYERHCAVCHGVQGAGDGPMRGPGKFPVIPPLISGPALGRADGYVYAIIRAGRGLMPSYGARMTHLERWSAVIYVKQLQANAGAAAPPPAAGVPPAAPAPPDTSPTRQQTAPAVRDTAGAGRDTLSPPQ
jgi:mono/diheme cytochrome c family protein